MANDLDFVYLTQPRYGRRASDHAPGKNSHAATAGTQRASRAAQYVRMSTDDQECSPLVQRDGIARYAKEHGLEIVATYADEGRSGLTLQGRPALCELIKAVASGSADFGVVLVYDVSRWGRFQDVDEAAFYEFLCRRSGIRVEYCMEPFRNDGTPMAAVMKGLKRVMAGEYSRELSNKVWESKCRMVRMGHRVGGAAGYGFRRMLVDAEGRPRGVMEYGHSKFTRTDRVVLVPGPPEELKVLDWIFRQIAYCGRRPNFIARELNRRGVPATLGRRWNAERVARMLLNEKYIGTLVFNRTSLKLRTPKVINPDDEWVQFKGAHPAVVDPKLFRRAQAAMARWPSRLSNEHALPPLRALFLRHGRLTADLIDAAGGMPGSAFYRDRFGGLLRAYGLVGYTPEGDYGFLDRVRDRLRRVVMLRREVIRALKERGVTAEFDTRTVLLVNRRLRLAVLLGRCLMNPGPPRWLIQLHIPRQPDLVLAACLDPTATAIQDYWLLPGGRHNIVIGVPQRNDTERHRSATLEPILNLIFERCGEDLTT